MFTRRNFFLADCYCIAYQAEDFILPNQHNNSVFPHVTSGFNGFPLATGCWRESVTWSHCVTGIFCVSVDDCRECSLFF